jgi:hypothetical protein
LLRDNSIAAPNHSFLAVAALLCFFFGGSEIVQRLLLEVDGTIVTSQTTIGNRPATTYDIRSSDGSRQLLVLLSFLA